MTKLLKFYRKIFIDSKYGIPLIIIIIYIFISTILIFLFEVHRNNQFKHIFDALWWTFVTFSTTGYGDKVPITYGGKIVAIITILTGLGLVSFLSGTMASIFVDRSSIARRGLMDFKKVKNHIIICGWKDPMSKFLKELLRFNNILEADEIILVSNVASEKVEDLRKDENLKDVRFVRGDYFQEKTLKRANLKYATKMMILADTSEGTSISEVDSKTVMAVLTAKAMNKDVYICAELLDKKYEFYLKQALCDEIHFSMDYNRVMLGNAITNSGITHIFYELLGHEKSKSRLITIKIDPKFFNKTYGELKKEFFELDEKMIVGILENSGSPRIMKKEALREAQKTANVPMLLENLQKVKEININHPVLLPSNDYIIKSYSKAIIVERT